MPGWFAWSVVALICWGVWAVIGRMVGSSLSPAQTQALSTVGLLPIMAVLPLMTRRQAAGAAQKGSSIAFSAGVVSCLGNVAYYDVLNRGEKAATVVPLTAMYPLVTITLAVVFLRERLSRVQVGGIALSLAAIYLLNVAGGRAVFNSWVAYALLPIGMWGVTGFLQKLCTNDISGERSTFFFLLAFVPTAALILFVQPLPASISAKTWIWAVALGVFFGVGNLAILLAFARHGKASVITPFTGLYPLVSVPLAVIWFREKISLAEGVGIGLALIAVVLLSSERTGAPAVAHGPQAQSLTSKRQ
jgi:transporter family protein